MRRTLVLKKETLAELTPRELRAVNGAARQSDDCIDPPSNVCIRSYDALCLLSRAMVNCPTEPTLLCD